MADLGLPVVDRAVQDFNTWTNDLAATLSCDKLQAYHALRAGLHTLRDRLTVDEATDLGAQLPMLVRGIYYEGWHPAATPDTTQAARDYVATVASHLATEADPDPQATASAVFALLKRQCDDGQMRQVRNMLPRDVAETLYDAA